MPDIKITKLHCLRTEDTSGGDEPKLVILVDGNIAGQISISDMDVGDVEIIDKTVSFNSQVVARLFEEDTGFLDEDDFLGQVTIGPDDDNAKGIFDLDDAYYVLEWENVTPTASDDTDISVDDSPGDSPGSNPQVHEISLGKHRILPNQTQVCPSGIPPFGHGVDTRELRIKVTAEARYPAQNDILNDVKECAVGAATTAVIAAVATKGVGATQAIALFKTTFYVCLKAKVGNTLASKVKVQIKTKKEYTDWSGH